MRTPTLVSALVALAIGGLGAAASAQVALIPVQGFLTDSGGVPVEGTLPAHLRLYTTATGGTPLWEATGVSLQVTGGRFTHHLGQTAALDLAHFNGQRVYLGISLAGQPELFPRVELATTPYAAYAARAGSMPFSALTGVPAGLADGDDNTTYTASAPLALVGSALGMSAAGCVAGETWVWDGSAWACEPAGANYTFTGGLAEAAGTVSINDTVFQRRIGSTCDAGSSIRAISSSGAVTCEPDDAGDPYLPGAGLNLSGTTFAVDPAAVQSRVTGTCDPGFAIRAIAQSGLVTCEPDDGSAYFAGAGLGIAGTTFAVNTDEVQARVTGTCDPGSAIRSINSAGAVVCQPNTVDTDTTYTAGSGLHLTGTTFSLASGYQQVLTGACSGSQFVQAVAPNGTVTCGTATDNNTEYTASTGLTLTGTVFSANFAQTQQRVTGTCAAGQYVQSITQAGGVNCATPTDNNSGGDITGITTAGGSGLTGGVATGSANLAVNYNEVQARLQTACPAGQATQSVTSAGVVTCTSRLRNAPFEMLQRSANMLTGGGTMRVSSGFELSWTGRIINITSLHSSWNASMHQDFYQPLPNTVIPGINGTSSVTVTANGVPIPEWGALYYRMSEGDGSNTSLSSRYVVVSYPQLFGDAGGLGAEYMLIAMRHGTHGTDASNRIFVNTEGGVMLGPGQTYDSRFGEHFVRQITDTGAMTYREHNPQPFHMTLTYSGSYRMSRQIPHDILLEYCADREGCTYAIAMHRWDGGNTWGASVHSRFYYSPTYVSGAGHYWRTSNTYGGAESYDGNNSTGHLLDAGGWHACYLTDGVYNWNEVGDQSVGINLLYWTDYGYSTRTCELTIWD